MSSYMLPQVADFEYLINSSLAYFIESCNSFGEPLATLGLKITEAFHCTRDLIHYGLCNSEPTKDSAIMLRYFNAVRSVVEYAETTRDNTYANHLSTVKEAITALAWITVKPAPCSYIKDIKEAGDYFSIRVLSSNKGNQSHVNWVNRWNQLMFDLLSYVKANFLTGFTWSSNKLGQGNAAPPPPPPPPQFDAYAVGDSGGKGDGMRQALLNQLNQGSNITRSLKPVNRNDPLHEKHFGHGVTSKINPSLNQTPAKPPKFVLEGKKWLVEYQKKNFGMSIKNEDFSQCLSMFGCEECSLEVVNKINGVIINNCKKSSVALKSVISGVELIRCSRLKIECSDSVPLINMDNCDEIEIYLSSTTARNVEIVSSKSTSCNVCLVEPSTGDYKELPLPEQIKTVLKGDHLMSTVLEKN